jgi:hypothetical protein
MLKLYNLSLKSTISYSPYAILVFVANGDRHYSPARIAGSAVKKHSVAEGDEQLPA